MRTHAHASYDMTLESFAGNFQCARMCTRPLTSLWSQFESFSANFQCTRMRTHPLTSLWSQFKQVFNAQAWTHILLHHFGVISNQFSMRTHAHASFNITLESFPANFQCAHMPTGPLTYLISMRRHSGVIGTQVLQVIISISSF